MMLDPQGHTCQEETDSPDPGDTGHFLPGLWVMGGEEDTCLCSTATMVMRVMMVSMR